VGAPAAVVFGVITLFAGEARADADAGVASPTSDCVERIAEGAVRPEMKVTFPPRQTSGYAARLHVEITHQKGETVLPDGLTIDPSADHAKRVQSAQFSFTDPAGGFAPEVKRGDESGDHVTTTVDLPLVPLPKNPGRNQLVLPPLPIVVARKNGAVSTLCTPPQVATVEDPTSATPEAKPKPNPPPMPQREEWTLLRQIVQWGAIGILIGGLLSYVIYRIATRPKPLPPPPPPRPPWEVALERLLALQRSTLLHDERYEEYTDRVSDAVRGYLGARYGFDGLESTTDEITLALKRAALLGVTHAEVSAFLMESDLVKFAGQSSSRTECERLLTWAESIVRNTMPASHERRVGERADGHEGAPA
jgi:hypothetical protein